MSEPPDSRPGADARIEAALTAWRPRDPHGRILPSPAWADLDEAQRRQVFEDALMGTQTFRAAPASDGAEVELSLEYELVKYGPLRGLADAIFIRRALRDALRRTLFRFEIEAEEEARLR